MRRFSPHNLRDATVLCVGIALLAGCQDFDLVQDPSVNGVPNPPDLSARVQTDRSLQVTVPAVDVLWVIDDSCSMAAEQQRLADNFPRFMAYFEDSDLDYHIGVVSTDMRSSNAQGQLRDVAGFKWIDRETPSPELVFSAMADLGTAGDATERGRDAAWTGLVTRRFTENYGFYRENAALSVIVISDEDDQSDLEVISLPDFISNLPALKRTPGMVTFSSIVGPLGGCQTTTETGSIQNTEPGFSYLIATDAIGGITWSICDEDWSGLLSLLGIQAAGLRTEFFLSEIPVEDTIEVWVEQEGAVIELPVEEPDTGGEVPPSWVYNRTRNSVAFTSFVPPPLAEVFIEYQVLSGVQNTDEATAR
ncbi:MAG: hypothetical protein EP330_03600 [Deltaproteobacteria bacterium]|nr:MAG: hypothetical protein EP330_03600 [Deltaproteobacteria bacterium]